MKEKIKLFMTKLREMPDFYRVKFVFLFGSFSQKKQTKVSDIDFAVYYEGDEKQRFKFRIKLSAKLPESFDVQVFQDLPLYVRIEVLKGEVIYSKDVSLVYEKAYETIRRFDDFKRYYYDYIKSRRTRL